MKGHIIANGGDAQMAETDAGVGIWAPGGQGVAGGGDGGDVWVVVTGPTTHEKVVGAGYGPGGGGGVSADGITAAVGGGGGFGGAGGTSGSYGGLINPGTGGRAYGNLLRRLEAGSGGAGSAFGAATDFAVYSGGAGGGALEFGALGTMTFLGTAEVKGGGGMGSPELGGGGSGGGVLVHAPTIVMGSWPDPHMTIQATGGVMGGGGRVALQSTDPDLSGAYVYAFGGGWGAEEGVITIAVATLSTTDLDFGPVRVGESRALFMGVENTGDADTSVNGRFPQATGVFTGGGDVFSSLHPGQVMADAFTYTPTAIGDDSQTLMFLSNSGNPDAMLLGRGVGPVAGSSAVPGSTIDLGVACTAPLGIGNDTPCDEHLPDELIGLTLVSLELTGDDANLFSVEGFTAGQVLGASELAALSLLADPTGQPYRTASATLTIYTDEDAAFGEMGNALSFDLVATVPEPATLALLAAGGVGVLLRRRRT